MPKAMTAVTGAWRDAGRILQGNIRVLTLTSVLGMFGRSMAFPYVSLFILALGGKPEEVGIVASVAPLLGLIAFPLGGYLADHTDRAKLVGWTMIVSAAVEAIYVVAPSWQWLALGSLLMGFIVLQFPAYMSLMADSMQPQDRSRGVALMNTLSSAPAMLAPWIAGLLLHRVGVGVGVRYLYAFLALGNAISGVAALKLLREPSPREPNGLKLRAVPRLLWDTYGGTGALLRRLSTTIKVQAVVIILGFTINALAGPFWVVYAVDRLGLTTTEWGAILLVESIVRIVATVPAGMLGDHWGRTRCIILSIGLALGGLLLWVFVAGYWGTLAVRLLLALSQALFVPASTALLADSVPREIRGRAMAALGGGGVMIGASGGGTGGPGLGYLATPIVMAASLAAGFVYSADPRLPWYVASVCAVVALALAVGWMRDPHQAEV